MRIFGVGLVLGLCLLARGVEAVAPPFPGVTATTFTSQDDPLLIPDNASLISIVNVDLPGEVLDVDVTLDITHIQPDQLDIYLISPAGTTITLSTDNGGGNDDVFSGVTFDDQAPPRDEQLSAANVRNVTFVNAEPVGVVQPEGALGAAVGETALGPWALVIVDDSGGTTGMLQGWSMTITTLSSLPLPGPPASFSGPGGEIPDADQDGVASPATVSGLGRRLLHAEVAVNIEHTQADHIDLYLTAPNGQRIDLVTDIGGGNDDLYAGTVFDDDAPLPVSDVQPLPDDGTAFTRVIPEGAISDFLGVDPNGVWLLTAVDDSGGQEGEPTGWTITLVATAACGDAVQDPGEACDDGNGTNGDGCDADCSVSVCGNGQVGGAEQCDDGNTVDGDGCSSTCQLPETACDDCQDNDGDGLVDAADPGCQAQPLDIRKLTISTRKDVDKLVAQAGPAVGQTAGGPLSILIADGNGTVACTTIGELVRKGGNKLTVSGPVAGGTLTAVLSSKRGGSLVLKGKGLDLSGLDDGSITLGIRVGTQQFVGGGTLRTRGPKRVHP
jgi:cysteine-rich repeat protein